MVGVGLVPVHVRNLRHGQKRQQNETHHSHHRQKSGAAAFPEEMCLQSSQTNASTATILQNRTLNLTICASGRLQKGRILACRATSSLRIASKLCAMRNVFPSRFFAAIALVVLPFAATSAVAQTGADNSSQPAQNSSNQSSRDENSKPLSLKPSQAGVARNHRLILKDGSYQMARDYHIVGDRVRYLSQERGDWEELPVDMVDWDATRKWEKEHADLASGDASPAMKEAEELDQEESAERKDQLARTPTVAEGLELPDKDGVFVLDTFHGTPELVELNSSGAALNAKTRKGIAVFNPLAARRAQLELDGAHAKVHLHVNDPVIYLSLNVDDEVEPVLTHPFTVNTNGASAVNGNPGAQSAQSKFAIVRLDERQAVRILGAIKLDPNGAISQNENTILTKAETMAGNHWLRVTPLQKLTIGEYALVEVVSPSEINESVWDFRVDPSTGDNPGSIGPILRQPRD